MSNILQEQRVCYMNKKVKVKLFHYRPVQALGVPGG